MKNFNLLLFILLPVFFYSGCKRNANANISNASLPDSDSIMQDAAEENIYKIYANLLDSANGVWHFEKAAAYGGITPNEDSYYTKESLDSIYKNITFEISDYFISYNNGCSSDFSLEADDIGIFFSGKLLNNFRDPNPSKRVILDSNIWISFAIGKRLNELRIALTHPKIEVFVCQKLLWEVRITTQTPKLLRYISQERQKILLELMQGCQCVNIVEQISIYRDPNDDYLLDLAVTANADFLVTGDNDLLILKKYHNTNIVSFSSFMAAIDTL